MRLELMHSLGGRGQPPDHLSVTLARGVVHPQENSTFTQTFNGPVSLEFCHMLSDPVPAADERRLGPSRNDWTDILKNDDCTTENLGTNRRLYLGSGPAVWAKLSPQLRFTDDFPCSSSSWDMWSGWGAYRSGAAASCRVVEATCMSEAGSFSTTRLLDVPPTGLSGDSDTSPNSILQPISEVEHACMQQQRITEFMQPDGSASSQPY